jgi:hypothetical protein
MKKITKQNMVKNFAIALFSLLTITGCQKETVTPTPPSATHTLMLVNWSRLDVTLFNRIDQSLNRDLMGRDDLFGRDTVYLNVDEIEYAVEIHPKYSGYFVWGDVRLALYDNGVLKQTYERINKKFYIRYQAK